MRSGVDVILLEIIDRVFKFEIMLLPGGALAQFRTEGRDVKMRQRSIFSSDFMGIAFSGDNLFVRTDGRDGFREICRNEPYDDIEVHDS